MAIRIGHCIHGLRLGGVQEIIERVVAGTLPHGIEHVVYAGGGGVFRSRIEHVGGAVRILPRRLPKLDPVWALRLARALRDDGICVVHTHLFEDSVHGVWAARRAGLPLLMTLHQVCRDLPTLQRPGYRWLLPRATRVVACSDEVRRSFAQAMGDRARIETVSSGFEPETLLSSAEARQRLGLPHDARVIGSIGRLSRERGLPLLLAAFAKLDATETPHRLVLLGDGAERKVLEAEARRLGIGDRVTFTGERSDARALLAAFDVVASSSPGDGLPISLLDAMSAGRALVWTSVAGVADAARDGKEALLVSPGDVEQLREALARALGDRTLRERLGRAAQTRFTERFTGAKMVQRYREVYESLARPAMTPRGEAA